MDEHPSAASLARDAGISRCIRQKDGANQRKVRGGGQSRGSARALVSEPRARAASPLYPSESRRRPSLALSPPRVSSAGPVHSSPVPQRVPTPPPRCLGPAAGLPSPSSPPPPCRRAASPPPHANPSTSRILVVPPASPLPSPGAVPSVWLPSSTTTPSPLPTPPPPLPPCRPCPPTPSSPVPPLPPNLHLPSATPLP